MIDIPVEFAHDSLLLCLDIKDPYLLDCSLVNTYRLNELVLLVGKGIQKVLVPSLAHPFHCLYSSLELLDLVPCHRGRFFLFGEPYPCLSPQLF